MLENVETLNSVAIWNGIVIVQKGLI